MSKTMVMIPNQSLFITTNRLITSLSQTTTSFRRGYRRLYPAERSYFLTYTRLVTRYLRKPRGNYTVNICLPAAYVTIARYEVLFLTSFFAAAYHALFPFAKFNAVQSACFSNVIGTDENMVISAPTGSGKTVLFELAIVKMLMDNNDNDSKCIYISPTKVNTLIARGTP
jgi:hypothetical protein